MRTRLALTLALLALGVAACGDDENGEEAEEASVTPQQAIAEIAQVRRGLDEAAAAYRAGDAEQASTLVEDAYLEHFEVVEGPLEDTDPELNEELEEQIREELTSEIEAGAPVPEVEDLIIEIETGLDDAESALEAAG
jgi:hypothetical protein